MAFTFKGNIMSELQPAEDYVIESDDVVEVEDSELEVVEDSESAPETEDAQDNPTKFSDEQQKIFDEAVGKKVFKLREKEREAEALKKRLEELEARVPKQQRPQVPQAPDPFAISDEEYRRQLQLRDQAVANAAAYDQQQRYLQEQQQKLQQEQAQKQHEEFNTKVESYSARAVKLGMTPEELQLAGNTVQTYGISDEHARYLIDKEDGPLVTNYLSKNPLELEKLSSMTPEQGAVYLATAVSQKAAALKPKVNSTPDPLQTPHGSGTSPKPKGPVGATFE